MSRRDKGWDADATQTEPGHLKRVKACLADPADGRLKNISVYS